MIDVRYSVTQEEFQQAQKLWCPAQIKKVPGRYLVLGLGITLGVLVGWSLHYLPLWLSSSIYGLMLATYFAQRWRRRKALVFQYDRMRKDLEDISVRFDDVGYHYAREARHEGSWMWPAFTGWREGPLVVVIGRGLSFVTVPKRALNAQEMETLRTLLGRNVCN